MAREGSLFIPLLSEQPSVRRSKQGVCSDLNLCISAGDEIRTSGRGLERFCSEPRAR